MSAPSTPPPVTLSRFGARSDALDAGLVPERPQPHERDVRGLYLTDREKWLTRHLARQMAPRVEWDEDDWPVPVPGCGYYPVLAAVCGVNGITPPSRERLFIRDVWDGMVNAIGSAFASPTFRAFATIAAAERAGRAAAEDVRRDQAANPRDHRGEPSAEARALAWLP